MGKLSFKDLVGYKVLILGESGSGKTTVLAKLLEEAVSLEFTNSITLIDFAPARHGNIGGKLTDYTRATAKVRYLTDNNIKPPRVIGKSRVEVLRLAKQNMKIGQMMLRDYEKSPTATLMINDLTIFLHSGELGQVLRCVEMASTFIATAYSGSLLSDDKGSGVTERENRLVEELAKTMEKVVRLPISLNMQTVESSVHPQGFPRKGVALDD